MEAKYNLRVVLRGTPVSAQLSYDLGVVDNMLRSLGVRVTRHEFEGQKRLAYQVKGEDCGGFDNYDIIIRGDEKEREQLLDKLRRLLRSEPSVLMYVCNDAVPRVEYQEQRLVEELQKIADQFNGTVGLWSMGQPPYWHSTVTLGDKKYSIQFGEEEDYGAC